MSTRDLESLYRRRWCGPRMQWANHQLAPVLSAAALAAVFVAADSLSPQRSADVAGAGSGGGKSRPGSSSLSSSGSSSWRSFLTPDQYTPLCSGVAAQGCCWRRRSFPLRRPGPPPCPRGNHYLVAGADTSSNRHSTRVDRAWHNSGGICLSMVVGWLFCAGNAVLREEHYPENQTQLLKQRRRPQTASP